MSSYTESSSVLVAEADGHLGVINAVRLAVVPLEELSPVVVTLNRLEGAIRCTARTGPTVRPGRDDRRR